jgi:DeoR/GlpR family transcriptional regulator of sugar metabolism
MLGPYANDQLAQLNVRKTVLSVAGVNERGFYNSNMLLVETERAMMHAADQVIVVADSTKFGKQSLAHLCPLNAAKTLVVDEQLTDEWREKITAVGVDLVIATAK